MNQVRFIRQKRHRKYRRNVLRFISAEFVSNGGVFVMFYRDNSTQIIRVCEEALIPKTCQTSRAREKIREVAD